MNKPIDYFSSTEQFTYNLPDGVSKVFHRKLTEGQRRQYEDKTSREISLDQSTMKASVELKPGSARYELLKLAIIGWEISRKNDKGDLESVAFNELELDKFLNEADPDIISLVEEDIRAKNKWVALSQYQNVEAIDKEIERLQKLKEEKLKEGKK
jgi:hypothetical protein